MLEIKDLCFSYKENEVIKNFSLSLPDTGSFAIMGQSGCGKSTLLSLIMGIVKQNSGEINTENLKISCAFQEPRLLPWLSAVQNVNLVLGGKSQTLQKAKEKLSLLGLSDDYNKLPGELSGGMQKRVSLARALAFEGNIYLLDEPFGGLDSETKASIYPIIRKISKTALVLIITHDKIEAQECAEKIYFFDELNKGAQRQEAKAN